MGKILEAIFVWLWGAIGTLWGWLWIAIKWWFFVHGALLKLIGMGNALWGIIFFICSPFIFYWEFKPIWKLCVWINSNIRHWFANHRPKRCRDCGAFIKGELAYCVDCGKKINDVYIAQMRQKFQERLALAKQYETAGRLEEAAKIYDEFAEGAFRGVFKGNPIYLEEAGRVRKLAKTEYVEQSTVNINQLIPQLKELVNFKCPNCGSGIAINSKTSIDGLKFCSHCRSALNLSLISDYLQKML